MSSIVGKVFSGSKSEIGHSDNEKISAMVKVKIINSNLYACMYQEWRGTNEEPYLEKNFVGAYLINNGIKLLGLGTFKNPFSNSMGILDLDFRHPFINVNFPYLMVETNESKTTENEWGQYIIN